MKNSTRRNLLAKLGVAAAALAISGTSSTAQAGKGELVEAKALPISPKRAVKMEVEGTKLQVAVSIDPKQGGFVLNAAPADGLPKLGLDKGRKTLNLGVSISNGSVSIAGLDSVLNQAANTGRCWMEDVEIDVKL